MTRPTVLCIFLYMLPAYDTWLESIPESRLSLVGKEAIDEKKDSGDIVVKWSWAVGYGQTWKVLGTILMWSHWRSRAWQEVVRHGQYFCKSCWMPVCRSPSLVFILIANGG